MLSSGLLPLLNPVKITVTVLAVVESLVTQPNLPPDFLYEQTKHS